MFRTDATFRVLDLVPDAVLVHAGGNWLYANPPGVALLGAGSLAEIVGRPILETVPERYRAQVAVRAANVTRGGATPPLDQKLLRYDGREIDVAITANPLPLAEGGWAALLVVRDITDRMELLAAAQSAEARFRKLVENAFDCVLILDATGDIQYVSPSISRFGYTPAELEGVNVFAMFHPDDIQPLVNAFEGVAAAVGNIGSGTFRFRNAAGQWRLTEGIAVNGLDDEEIGGIVVNFRDVTERDHLQREVETMRRIESLGRVASTVAHEFNNVLMAIQPSVEMLERRHLKNDPAAARWLQFIADAVSRGRRIAGDILEFGKDPPLQKQATDVAVWVKEIGVELASRLEGAVSLTVRTEVEGAMSAIDRDRMSQVLTNIVLNARDAMIEGGPIDISVSALENAGNAFIEIEVRDSGPGMSEEIQSRVFEPFFTTKRSGNGLGLAISQRIVLRHGGAIEVDSCPGEGTTFRIQLPRL